MPQAAHQLAEAVHPAAPAGQRAEQRLDMASSTLHADITGFVEGRGGAWGARRAVVQRAALAALEGAEAIAAAGGLVVVQDPASASMPAMPHAALARVAVPHVLPPAGIAALLTHLHENCLL